MSTVVAFRMGSNSLAELAAQINSEHANVLIAEKRGFQHATKAGEFLLAAKKLVGGHGKWMPWLKENCKAPIRNCNVYMQLAKNKVRLSKLVETTNLTIDGARKLLSKPRKSTAEKKKTQEGKPSKGRPEKPLDPKIVTAIKAEPMANQHSAAKALGISQGAYQRARAKLIADGKVVIPSKTEAPRAVEKIGHDSPGEFARLRARNEELEARARMLEIKLKGYESEIEELKASGKVKGDSSFSKQLARLIESETLIKHITQWAGSKPEQYLKSREIVVTLEKWLNGLAADLNVMHQCYEADKRGDIIGTVELGSPRSKK